jgi:hypothetical protein
MAAQAELETIFKEVANECKRRAGTTNLHDAGMIGFLLDRQRQRCIETERVESGQTHGCCVMNDSPAPLQMRGGLSQAILNLFDGDGDSLLEESEVELAAWLISIDAGLDEARADKRISGLKQLLARGPVRMATVDPTKLDAASLLGRAVVVDGMVSPVRVVGVPTTTFMSRRKKGFSLREMASGEAIDGIELRYKGNKTGTGWRPAPPTHGIMASISSHGASSRNPLLDDPSLTMSPVVASLSGSSLAAGRVSATCVSESFYRLCGIVPCWPLLPCFWPHGCMVSPGEIGRGAGTGCDFSSCDLSLCDQSFTPS